MRHRLDRCAVGSRHPAARLITVRFITNRSLVVDRKGKLLSDLITSAQASANPPPLVETSKANDFDPYRHLHR